MNSLRFRGRACAAILCAAAVLGLSAAPAGAASNPVVGDCVAHGKLTHHYTVSQLRSALRSMSPSTRQYTDCQDVINAALTAALKMPESDRGTGGGSGSFLPTPVIVILAVLFVGALTLGLVAARRTGGQGG